jgi:hypothetical protein
MQKAGTKPRKWNLGIQDSGLVSTSNPNDGELETAKKSVMSAA